MTSPNASAHRDLLLAIQALVEDGVHGPPCHRLHFLLGKRCTKVGEPTTLRLVVRPELRGGVVGGMSECEDVVVCGGVA